MKTWEEEWIGGVERGMSRCEKIQNGGEHPEEVLKRRLRSGGSDDQAGICREQTDEQFVDGR